MNNVIKDPNFFFFFFFFFVGGGEVPGECNSFH